MEEGKDHCTSCAGAGWFFNRHMSTGHHSNGKLRVEEKIKIALSLCQM